jgi:hypothetical protein
MDTATGNRWLKAVRDGDLDQMKRLYKAADATTRPLLGGYGGNGRISALHWAATKGKQEHGPPRPLNHTRTRAWMMRTFKAPCRSSAGFQLTPRARQSSASVGS